MLPNPFLVGSVPSTYRAPPSSNPIKKEKVFAAMNLRSAASSIEPFLGSYRIVWDSESNYDPRDVLFEDDLHNGLLTLTRPQRAYGWPKEPATPSSVVLRLCDSFLGTDRSASVLKPSPRPIHGADRSLSQRRRTPSLSDSPSPPLSSPPSPSPPYAAPLSPHASTPSLCSSRSSAPSRAARRTPEATREPEPARRFWRFDWDPSFPRLGFRFEGMDLSAPCGHALSFARIRDDRGHPFAVLDLRATATPEARGRGRGGAVGEAAAVEPRYITVVAKRVPDTYAREGLSEAERARLGMVELDEYGRPVAYD
ncbi:hypothetical protein BD413DRAFT_531723 [Trametes elegans]|nr:hypothetical protein BD413DRAFT_531723 [Trametes elegans]